MITKSPFPKSALGYRSPLGTTSKWGEPVSVPDSSALVTKTGSVATPVVIDPTTQQVTSLPITQGPKGATVTLPDGTTIAIDSSDMDSAPGLIGTGGADISPGAMNPAPTNAAEPEQKSALPWLLLLGAGALLFGS